MRTVTLARRLRRELNLPEVLLSQALRSRPVGLKFRKQDPTGDYVLDFYCASARLAVEVNGATRGDVVQVSMIAREMRGSRNAVSKRYASRREACSPAHRT